MHKQSNFGCMSEEVAPKFNSRHGAQFASQRRRNEPFGGAIATLELPPVGAIGTLAGSCAWAGAVRRYCRLWGKGVARLQGW